MNDETSAPGRRLNRLSAVIGIAAMTVIGHTARASDWDEVKSAVRLLETLDGLCIRNESNFSVLATLMKAMRGWKPVEDDVARASATPHVSGATKGFSSVRDGQVLLLLWNENNACSVSTNRFPVSVVKRQIAQNFQVSSGQRFDEGMQVNEFFDFKKTSMFSGCALVLSYFKDQNMQGYHGTISYLPSRTVQKLKGRK